MFKNVKHYLVYAIFPAIIYLIMPVFFQGENYRYDAIEYQFVFPATALLTGVAYSWKNGVDFTFPLVAPIIYIGSVLIYSHYYHWAIYVFIYLIVGMLGCFIGDMVYKSNKAESQKKKQPKPPTVQEDDSYKIKITDIKIDEDEK